VPDVGGPEPQEVSGSERGAREAFERAVEAFSHKERTAAEIGAWLAGRGFDPADIEAAVGRLVEAGALDDERFARRFAEDKRELRGWGPERIRDALDARGVDRELIEAALAGEGRDAQLDRAVELLEGRGDAPRDEAARARALAFLARRGYDSELAYDAVRVAERRAA
jgi:regulatory protein